MTVRARLLTAAVGGVLAVIGAALLVEPRLGLGDAYPLRAAVWSAVMLTIAAWWAGGHHPYPRLGPANRVTVVRTLLLALVAGLIGEPATTTTAWAAVAGGTIIAVLDGVDGAMARRSGMSSEFGARFDMETDALLIMVLSVLVWHHAKAGVWVLAGGLIRYAWIAAAWMLPWMSRPLSPTLRAKTIAVAHMIGLMGALGPIIPWPLSAAAAATTLAALCWSFAVDFGRLRRMA